MSSAEETRNQATTKKPRYRSSAACCACRERRIRCVMNPRESSCSYCTQASIDCVIRDNDERKRPTSKAYTNTLTNRIQLLEKMLVERGEQPPPVVYPPKTKQSAPSRELDPPVTREPDNPIESTIIVQEQQQRGNSESQFFDIVNCQMNDDVMRGLGNVPPDSPLIAVYSPPKEGDLISRVISTDGHWSVDQMNGRQRYYGPTSNCHIYSELLNGQQTIAKESPDHVKRTKKILRSLSQETHDYLMSHFWECYNEISPTVDQAAFSQDSDDDHHSNPYYSGFLHICMLAMGYRFAADKNREDMKRLVVGGIGRETILQREAKFILDDELEGPCGIPSIVALLLLGDLECGVGRDNTGWMYAGMACRLAFDTGLHLASREMGLSETDIRIREMTLQACMLSDKHWSLFLGRPISIKRSDIRQMSKRSESRLNASKSVDASKTLGDKIYEAMLDLMELAGKITGFGGTASHASDLHTELGRWHQNLPTHLRWTPENIKTAPMGFFLLHQQYHCIIILLHRPFALYLHSPATESTNSAIENYEEASAHDGYDKVFSKLSRNVCTIHAVQIARIFWQHRSRFPTRQIYISGMQHAGTAAISLIAALSYVTDPKERAKYMQYLECLASAILEMTSIYKPAEVMSALLNAVTEELKATKPKESHSSCVPARRPSSNELVKPRLSKRPNIMMSSANISVDPRLADLTSVHNMPFETRGLEMNVSSQGGLASQEHDSFFDYMNSVGVPSGFMDRRLGWSGDLETTF